MAVAFIRTLILYTGLLAAVRLMGKRQIGQLQTTELIVMLLIADLASIPMQDTAQPLASGLIPIVVLVFCELAVSVGIFRFPKLRRLFCGRPVVVIRDGTVLPKALKDLRLSPEELYEQLRQKDVKRAEEAELAVVETNGMLSVLRYDADNAATPRQLQLSLQEKGPQLVVIDNGQWCRHSLRLCRKSQDWCEAILRKKKLQPKEVFLMTANEAGETRVIPRCVLREHP